MNSRFVRYNANPSGRDTIDCVVRALSLFLGWSWEATYDAVTEYARSKHDVMILNWIWAGMLRSMGYWPNVIPNTCPDCYSVSEFCRDNPYGTYLLATESHVVTVINGKYYDTWDSGQEVPLFYWRKE